MLFRAGLALSVCCADTARVAAPSVCCAAACILLAAAPTAPPCFRHWRRSSPLLPKGEALASRIVSCIFLPKFMLYLFCGSSRPSYLGREVYLMIHILTILESVVADIMSHYICKWLDRFDKDRKPD